MHAIEIAKTYIQAAQTGDQATLGRVISPDVVWHQPGHNQFSGTHRGMAAVGQMLGQMMAVSQGTFAITRADHYMANGDWVAITIEFAGQANGMQLKQPGVDLIRIEGGKIVEVWLFWFLLIEILLIDKAAFYLNDYSSAFALVLTPERKLSREDIAVVLENLEKQGYHLQMPPAEDEYIEHLPEELLRRNDPM